MPRGGKMESYKILKTRGNRKEGKIKNRKYINRK